MTGQEYNNQFSEEELATEIWKDIKDWEGYYQVSSLGRVKSLERVVPHAYSIKLTMKERLLNPGIDKNNYYRVVLCRNGIPHGNVIHLLMVGSFLEKKDSSLEVCHNDGNPSNNRIENLRIDTSKNNQADRIKHGTDDRGEKSPNSKLKEKNVIEIRELYKTGRYTTYKLADVYGVRQSTIFKIIHKKRWSWLE